MIRSMPHHILYLGDTTLTTAASYLAGCLQANGWNFAYLPSSEPLTEDLLHAELKLVILSDYPAAQLSTAVQSKLVERVQGGTNLLMIGGWESFHGLGGDWNQSLVADLLPVEIGVEDDRQNCDSPVFLRAQGEHPITAELPWDARPPLIGGYNRVTAKPGSKTLLTAERYQAAVSGNGYQLTPRSSDPLLVIAEEGTSRRTALMTDLAPHWVGPFVDWGTGRVAARADGTEGVEVGDLYFQFVTQLIRWAGQLPA